MYALSSWLTKLMPSAGYSQGWALTFVLVLNFGAMLGAIGGGWLADRFNIKYVLVGMYALAAVLLIDHKKSASVQQQAAAQSRSNAAGLANGAGEPA